MSKECLFGDLCQKCTRGRRCEFFAPLYETDNDYTEQVEECRDTYYDAYIEYISEYSDFNFDTSC